MGWKKVPIDKECVKKVRLLKGGINKKLDKKKGIFQGDLLKLDKKGKVVKAK